MTLRRLARSPSTAPRSLCRLRRPGYPPIKEGMLPAPPLRPVCGVNPSKVKRPGKAKKTGAGAATKRGRAKSGSIPKRTAPSPSNASGSLKPEGIPPPHGSGYPARTDHVDSPTTVGDSLLRGYPTRTTPTHAIGCEALAMGKRINGAESGTWDSPGTPHSQGPTSSSGFTRCSGIPVTQASSERALLRGA